MNGGYNHSSSSTQQIPKIPHNALIARESCAKSAVDFINEMIKYFHEGFENILWNESIDYTFEPNEILVWEHYLGKNSFLLLFLFFF